jgi:hypothetical protein
MLTHAAADGLRRRQPDLDGRLFAPRAPARLFGPSLPARIAARLRAASLDASLAAGADPAQCPQLAARAAYLTSRTNRRRLAATVECLVHAATLPAKRLRVRPARRAVVANGNALLELAAILRDPGPVYARGVAELWLALRDGNGPVYVDHHGEALARQVAVVSAGLRG